MIYGTIYLNGVEQGEFKVIGDQVRYSLNSYLYSLSINAFETMCEALGYRLCVVLRNK